MTNENLNQNDENDEKYDESEPQYECDYEYPCQCTEDGIEGEWSWSPDDECWVCQGCGDTQ